MLLGVLLHRLTSYSMFEMCFDMCVDTGNGGVNSGKAGVDNGKAGVDNGKAGVVSTCRLAIGSNEPCDDAVR